MADSRVLLTFQHVEATSSLVQTDVCVLISLDTAVFMFACTALVNMT